MAPHLLSLLSQIESALADHGATARAEHRSVNYAKGLARLSLSGGGAITLQNFHFADGQICVKAALSWPNVEHGAVHAVYPQGQSHDWAGSADGIAAAWVAGPQGALISTEAEPAQLRRDRLVAVNG